MKRLSLLLLLIAAPAWSAEPIFKAYAGLNGVWFDSQEDIKYPSDLEGGAVIRASLSKHISAVGSTFYGFDKAYVRAALGARVTAVNADSPDLSVGLGIQYHVSNDESVRPQEWAPDASVGWRAWPSQAPNLVLVAQGSYGLESQQAQVLAGIRYELGGIGR